MYSCPLAFEDGSSGATQPGFSGTGSHSWQGGLDNAGPDPPSGQLGEAEKFLCAGVGRVIPDRGECPIKPAWAAALWQLSQAQQGLTASPRAHLTPNAETVAISSS